jgi:hypothetical protein
MSYGAFGQVAAHEITVRSIFRILHVSPHNTISSTLSILLGGCTTKKVGWSNGGQMPQAKASM